MKNVALVLIVVAGSALAQSNLPVCNTGTVLSSWTDCFGTHAGGGAEYVGEWRNGKFNGQGTFTFANGNKYVGEFRDGKFNGQGTVTYANGNKYVGVWRDGKIEGQGTFTFANGDTYVGEWRDVKIEGHGTLTYANGNKYVGEFRDGKFNGQGTFTFADGRPSQEGIWEDNKFIRAQHIPDHIAGRVSTQPETKTSRQGSTSGGLLAQTRLLACEGRDISRWTNCFGTHYFVDGTKYVGEWKDGKRNGRGTYSLANGVTGQEGVWNNDNFVSSLPACGGDEFSRWTDCFGTQTWSSGAKYVGEWKNGKFNGQGLYTYSDRVTFKNGFWYQDKFYSALPACKGKDINLWTDCFGNHTWGSAEYVGEWRNGKFNGQGIFISADRRTFQEGLWENDRFVREQRASEYSARGLSATPSLQPSPSGSSITSDLYPSKKKCSELGLKPGTEKFGECVLRLSK